MNPCIRRITFVLMLYIVIILHNAVSAVAAPLAPEANYLGRITGVVAPVRLAIDAYGKIYVADPRNGGVLQFDSAGNLIKKFPVKGARGVAITPAGELVVSSGNTVSVINTTTGSTLFQLTPFKQANGVAVDDAGLIYVVDSLDSVVQVFFASGQPVTITNSSAGKPFNSFGTNGPSDGQFSLPTAIAYDRVSKQLVVSDTGNSRLAFFDKAGRFIRTIGGRVQNGTAPAFTSPQSVSLEYTKTIPEKLLRVYVSDSYQSEVQIVDPQGSGTSLGSIGGYGSAPGKLKVPVDTLFDPATSRLLIANGAGDITIYGINVTSSPLPDTTPPLLTIDPTPAVTYTGALVIGGSVEKEAQLQITAPQGVVVGEVNYYSAPDVSILFWQAGISALNTGANIITVTARDSASNPTTKTAAITYDPTTVKVTISAFAAPVNNPAQALSGTADVGATVVLTGPAGVTFTPVTFVPGTTTWQSSVAGLAAGINTITATATIGANSSSATTRITLLVSNPDLQVSTLPDGSITAQPILNVSGTVPQDSYFVSLIVNDAPVKFINSAFSTTVVLKPGSNKITIMALDAAGNISEIIRNITLDETLPTIAFTEPSDGAYINGPDINLRGKVLPGNTVRLLLYNGSSNGVPFTQISQTADGSWSTAGAILLDPGLNTIVAEVTDISGNSVIKTTITRDAAVPALAATGPIRDISVNRPSQTVTGTVAAGTDISATVNGTDVPVTVGTGGTYSIPVTLADEIQYAVAITATDPLGNSATTYRNLVYDVTAPKITAVDPANPLRITFSEGIPVVFDKNGAVTGFTTTTNPDGSKTVDVSKAGLYDLKTLDIHAADAAGNSTRNGDINGNGKVDITDAFKLLRLALVLDPSTPEQKLRGDVAPTLKGVSKPDGVLDVFDVVYVLEKIVGLR
ncbi:MAG: hypothetical protein WA003_06400 [Desulfuromonadaceae bacterium]